MYINLDILIGMKYLSEAYAIQKENDNTLKLTKSIRTQFRSNYSKVKYFNYIYTIMYFIIIILITIELYFVTVYYNYM